MDEIPLTTDPPTSIAELSRWTERLGKIASEPLAFCEHFPRIVQRFEAWWSQECLDRPLFIGQVNTRPDRPITPRLELLDEPDAWLAAKLIDMQQTRFVGDAVPHLRVDLGPALLGGLFGGRREFGLDTAWTHPLIDDDWSNEPAWIISDEDPLWHQFTGLLHVAGADAAGRYLLGLPDPGGSADVLLDLRGSTQLCLDAAERPERVRRAIDAMYPAWHRVFCEMYRATVQEHGVGVMHWFCLWSSRPQHALACDFNCAISPTDFQRLCLPDIARQAATVERACFHLDGPDAARHVDALLEVPDIQAIQFTPGAASPSALQWVDMFRKIQARGRSVLVFCPPEEVLALCEALRPEGLAVLLENPPPADQIDSLYAALCQRFGCAL